jgi:hypothetical protein
VDARGGLGENEQQSIAPRDQMKRYLIEMLRYLLMLSVVKLSSQAGFATDLVKQEYEQLSNYRPVERNRILSRLSKEKKLDTWQRDLIEPSRILVFPQVTAYIIMSMLIGIYGSR